MVTFRREDRDRVANGEITVTFRLWKSAHVKAGKTYSTGFGEIEIDDVELLPAALITEEDVAPSGCADIAAIWASAGDHTKTNIEPDTLLYRVQFRFRSGPREDLPRDAVARPVSGACSSPTGR